MLTLARSVEGSTMSNIIQSIAVTVMALTILGASAVVAVDSVVALG
jgi:hypothetical protein